MEQEKIYTRKEMSNYGKLSFTLGMVLSTIVWVGLYAYVYL